MCGGEVEVKCHAFLNSAPYGGSWSVSFFGRFAPRNPVSLLDDKRITLFYGTHMGLNVTLRRTTLLFTRRVYYPSQFCLFSLFLKDNPFAIACDYSLNNFTDINSISDKSHHFHRRLKPTDAIFSTYLLTYSMVQSLSWEANWFAASQEIPRISRNPKVRHLSLSWASPIQSIYPHSTSWRSILILPTHLRLGLPSGFFPSGFPTKTLYIFSTAL